MTKPKPTRAQREADLLALADRPGFLIRRLHQIHVALFHEECAAYGLTPVQYSVLTALQREGILDQASIAVAVGIDRANTADVVARLEKRGLLRRSGDKADLRVKRCALTQKGLDITTCMESAVERAQARTLAALPDAERRRFHESLCRIVEANNALGRAPLRLR